MQEIIQLLIESLPSMLAQSGATIALLVVGVWLYLFMTPYDDMKLIREGNVASAISLFGIIVGLAIPLALCLAAASSIAEIVVLGTITVALQLFAFKLVDWILHDLPKRIERGEVSAAILLLGVKLATAFINSAMG
jgi:putative membrane protein